MTRGDQQRKKASSSSPFGFAQDRRPAASARHPRLDQRPIVKPRPLDPSAQLTRSHAPAGPVRQLVRAKNPPDAPSRCRPPPSRTISRSSRRCAVSIAAVDLIPSPTRTDTRVRARSIICQASSAFANATSSAIPAARTVPSPVHAFAGTAPVYQRPYPSASRRPEHADLRVLHPPGRPVYCRHPRRHRPLFRTPSRPPPAPPRDPRDAASRKPADIPAASSSHA